MCLHGSILGTVLLDTIKVTINQSFVKRFSLLVINVRLININRAKAVQKMFRCIQVFKALC